LSFVSIQAPDFKYAVKTNVFIGKFIELTFHIAGRVRACTPWKFTDAPVGRVKNH